MARYSHNKPPFLSAKMLHARDKKLIGTPQFSGVTLPVPIGPSDKYATKAVIGARVGATSHLHLYEAAELVERAWLDGFAAAELPPAGHLQKIVFATTG